MTITLTTPMQIQSQNVHNGAHWRHYHRYRDAWHWSLLEAMYKARVRRPHHAPSGIVRVKITSYRARLLDFGNLIGGAKPLPDFLVRMKFLFDDGPKWCGIDYEQVQVPGREAYTKIEIFED